LPTKIWLCWKKWKL